MYLVHDLFGTRPAPYHLVNVGLHLVNALLLMGWIYLREGSLRVGFISALLFLVHCQHYRAVYWISAISLVLGLTFLLVALILVEYYLNRPRRMFLGGAVGSFLLSLLCHQAMVAAAFFPALMGMGRRLSQRQHLGLLLAFALPGCAVLLGERYAYGGGFTGQETYLLVGTHVFTNLFKYCFGLFAGGHLDLVHFKLSMEGVLWLGAGWTLGVLGLALKGQTRLWALWVLLGTLPFAFWARSEVFSRYYYLPAVGSSALLALGLVRLQGMVEKRWGGWGAWGVVGVNTGFSRGIEC